MMPCLDALDEARRRVFIHRHELRRRHKYSIAKVS